MYYARVEAEFAAAHFLSLYHGKCENLHGHNYRARLFVRGETLDSGGMLVDFAVLKKILKEICGGLDHSNLNDMAAFQNNPSAERIAEYIYEKAKKKLEGLEINNALLWAVEVYETRTCMARFEP
ncbi:MAG: 6-carboxytetrahydropterin synthase QueD [Treponema sp.]|jgi:6-pyruvoyltetrahydropterin/6-carboxytetrahydropterin synthase|nr:6-carboxytetrahydropterin synthase QueD [Treponema sp.]